MAESDDGMTGLVKRRFQLWREVVKVGDFVRGSVVVLRRPCTRANCRICKEGRRHPATYLSMKVKGRTRLVYLPRSLVSEARRWVAEWKRLESLLLELSQVNAEVLRLLGRRRSGKRQGKEST